MELLSQVKQQNSKRTGSNLAKNVTVKIAFECDYFKYTYGEVFCADFVNSPYCLALGHQYGSDRKCKLCCNKLYKVGDIGPAGGYIFYDCDADNDANGYGPDGLKSTDCGWRFLEVAPEDASSGVAFGFYVPYPST